MYVFDTYLYIILCKENDINFMSVVIIDMTLFSILFLKSFNKCTVINNDKI